MAGDKIIVNDEMLIAIINKRKEQGYKAQSLSEIISGSPYWLSNIENRKTTSMSRKNCIDLFKKLYSIDEKTAMDKIEEYELLYSNSITTKKKSDHGYKYKDYDKEYRRKINMAQKELLLILEKAKNAYDPKTYKKNLSVITTFIELLTTQTGIMKFEALFSIPLQDIDFSDMKKIISYINTKSKFEYKVTGLDVDESGTPNLEIVPKDNEFLQ